MRKNESAGFQFRTLLLKYFRIMIISLGLPVTVLTAVVLSFILANARTAYFNETNVILDKTTSYLDGIWDQMQSVGMQTVYDQSITDFFRGDRNLSIEMLNRLRSVFGYLRAMTAGSSVVDYAMVSAFSPEYYIVRDRSWSFSNAGNDFLWDNHPYGLIAELRESDLDSAWRQFGADVCYYQVITVRGERVGCFLQRSSSTKLTESVRDFFDATDRRLLLIDETGLVLYDSAMRSNGQPIDAALPTLPRIRSGQFSLENTEYYASTSSSLLSGMQYVLLSDMSGLARQTAISLLIGAVVIVLVLGICILVSYHFAQTICKPYLVILDLLRNPSKEASDNYHSQYAQYDELGMIYTLINQTMYQNMSMKNELTEREIALRDAQNIALQAQINPHFMFNTLEAINWKLFEKLPEDRSISGMIRDLSLLLRGSLESDEPIITARREIEHAKLYVKLQKNRLSEDFEVIWRIDPQILSLTMLRLSLQPLFENAIAHGIRKLDGGGAIEVYGRMEENTLRITVSDNGPGIEASTIERIQKNLIDSRWARSTHIGLVNVNTRIQLLYGVEYGVRIESVPYERTAITIVMPIHREEEL